MDELQVSNMVQDVIGDAARNLSAEYARRRDFAILGQVGLQVRGEVIVRLVRPWWMPDRLYRRLMRSIVVSERML